jgi:hypothetical protein
MCLSGMLRYLERVMFLHLNSWRLFFTMHGGACLIVRCKNAFREAGIPLPSEKYFISGMLVSNLSDRCIHRLLDILTSTEIYGTYVRLPMGDTPISTKITRSTLLCYFKECVGTLDGTHIPAHVPEANRGAYRNRKAQLSPERTCCV